jgi:hypothetical protein
MAPKPDLSDPKVKELLERFASISFTGQKANETLRNAKTSDVLSTLIERKQLGGKGLDAKQGQLVVTVASAQPATLSVEAREYILDRVLDGSLDSADRINVAAKYLAGVADVREVDKAAFDKECGVGEYESQPDCVSASCKMSFKHQNACIRAVSHVLRALARWHECYVL